MSECESIQESIGRWLDGEMPASEGESVRAHVARCADCGEAQRRLEKMQIALKNVLAAETTPIEFMPFWRAVERRISEKSAWYDDWLDRARGLFTAPRLAWAVPVAIGLLLVLFSTDGLRFGGSRGSFASVESIDAYGRSVALLRQNESKTTVIWLYQDQEGDNETADDSAKSAPVF